MKQIFIDTETTGTDPKTCSIFQIAGIVDIDNEVVEEFSFSTNPYENTIWEDGAIEKTGITPEIAATYEPASVVFEKFVMMLKKYISYFDKNDKFVLIGYNIRFDEEFIREWFKREASTDQYKQMGGGYGNFFWTPSFDIMNWAMLYAMNFRNKLPNFKLETVANAFGVDFNSDEAHEALYDIKKTRELAIKLAEISKN